jgi:hypothetical protein
MPVIEATVEQHYVCDKLIGLSEDAGGVECGRPLKAKGSVAIHLSVSLDGNGPTTTQFQFHSPACASFWLRRIRLPDLASVSVNGSETEDLG